MVKKDDLIRLVGYGHDAIVRFADTLSEEERQAGENDRWTGKDTLAHVIESKRRGVRRLAANARGEDITPDQDFNAANAVMVEKYRPHPWEELRTAIDAAQEELLAVLQDLSEEQLNDTQFHERLQGNAPWNAVMGTAVLHPLAFHLRPWYIQHGMAEEATRMAEEETRLALELDDSPIWQGTATYNLACHYALLGDQKTALEKLEAGLRLNPGLAEFSRDDSDFAALHGTPEFEAVVAGAAAV